MKPSTNATEESIFQPFPHRIMKVAVAVAGLLGTFWRHALAKLDHGTTDFLIVLVGSFAKE
jgi:hypothetical protein